MVQNRTIGTEQYLYGLYIAKNSLALFGTHCKTRVIEIDIIGHCMQIAKNDLGHLLTPWYGA